ncbi:MAG TPA: MarR family transcriptional regulator [Butyricicoccus pullicaecorum]|uniref:MarR family transcriptional regulator n=1 Tax=Butyricicoccus pullicaecorum TaxID=501571 RepID=A0A1Y4L4B5_9FIRM|nr:helix-turn-helix domain-containing protein [Butyricicoccus pullicaecorum]MDY2969174.1 helix-turn-helix domain-containing protein [Butyricicoccus pullicaecorum]OUP51623.1 MarR family transcriptional regulator [Butyricicoccus pullicaecorum]HJF52569.1 MarR family transcriptional regulator [Butyricicoccus pullicaecorum]
MEWTDMMHYQQQMQKIMRSLLPVRKFLLTASECELLAHLYLKPEQNTPVLLSQSSGMKKEAVSRCLKSLYEKNCIRKERQTTDERSYQLFITETGLAELKKGYESILQPFYDLWRSSREDFEAFMYYADRLAAQIEKGQEKTLDHEVL